MSDSEHQTPAVQPNGVPEELDFLHSAYSRPSQVGAPSTYDPHTAAYILQQVAAGEPLRRICRQDGMPDHVTFWRWMQRAPELRNAYWHARQLQSHMLVDEAYEAQDAAEDKDSAAAARVKVDALLKMAGLLNPAQYAPKGGNGGGTTVVINTSLSAPPDAQSGQQLEPPPVIEHSDTDGSDAT